MGEVTVRPYRSEDRVALRRACLAVGYMGESADFYWRHAESFAEIWTTYYTDREPESLFVAVRDDVPVGYLTGCVDSAAAPSPAQAITRNALRYGLFLRPGTAPFLWRGFRDSLTAGDTPSGDLRDPRWPSHLHINLLPEARGCGAGAALMNAWLERLSAVGSPGCHLGTLLENERAVGFFERMGFERHGEPQLAPGLRSPTGGRHHLLFMVRGVGPAPATTPPRAVSA